MRQDGRDRRCLCGDGMAGATRTPRRACRPRCCGSSRLKSASLRRRPTPRLADVVADVATLAPAGSPADLARRRGSRPSRPGPESPRLDRAPKRAPRGRAGRGRPPVGRRRGPRAPRVRRRNRRERHPVRRRDERRRRSHGAGGPYAHADDRTRSTRGPDRARRAERPRDVRRRHDRAGSRGGARSARPDARPLSAVVRAVDPRWLGRGAVGGPAVDRVRPDRRPLRRRARRGAGRIAGAAGASRIGRRPGPAPARPGLRGAARDRDRGGRPGRPAPPPRGVPGLVPAGLAARPRGGPRDRESVPPAVDGPGVDPARDRVAARAGRPFAVDLAPAAIPAPAERRARAVPPARRREWGGACRGGRRSRGWRPRPPPRRDRRRWIARAPLGRDTLPDTGPARRALGRGLRARHGRNGRRLDAAPRSRRGGRSRAPPRPRRRAASASTPSATSRMSIRAARASMPPTSSAGSPTRTRRSHGGAR